LPYPGAAPTSPGLHKLPTSTSSVPGGVASDTTGASTRGGGMAGGRALQTANQKPSTQTTRSHPKHPRGLLRPGPPSTHFHKERYPLCALRAELGRGTLNATPPPETGPSGVCGQWSAQRPHWQMRPVGRSFFPFFPPLLPFCLGGVPPPLTVPCPLHARAQHPLIVQVQVSLHSGSMYTNRCRLGGRGGGGGLGVGCARCGAVGLGLNFEGSRFPL
jgi:hypothetical protein